jgi:hypothetical protein
MAYKKSTIDLLNSHVSFLGQLIDSLSNQIHPSEQSILWLNKTQIEQLSDSWSSVCEIQLVDIINVIEQLPILPIIPDTDDAGEYIECERLNHRALALWLRQMLLQPTFSCDLEDRSIALPVNHVDENFSIARMWIVWLRLAEIVYPYSKDLQLLFPSSYVLWGCCYLSAERFRCREHGLTGEPVIRTKTDILKFVTKSLQHMEDPSLYRTEQMQLTAQQIGLLDRSEHLADLLVNEAMRLQLERDDVYGKDQNLYEYSLRLMRFLINFAKKQDYFQDSYLLPNGDIFTTAKNVKPPKRYRHPKSQG